MYNSWGLLLLSSGICYLVSMLLRGLEARPTATSKARPERYQKLRSPEQEVLYLAFPGYCIGAAHVFL